MPPSGSFSLRPPPRHPALDAARGLAVLAMVLGPTLQALLSPGARGEGWRQHSGELLGLTAAFFLMVSGWSVVAALDQRAGSTQGTYGRTVRRALLLIFLGYLLRWPGWDAMQAPGWGEALLARLFEFDVLQCMGVSLLVGSTVLALVRRSRTRALALGVLAVGIPLASPGVWQLGARLPVVLRQATGMEGSLFPLFPWAGFFFAGALVAWLLRLLRPGGPQALALAVLGAGMLGVTLQFPQDWSTTSVWLTALRVGQGLLVLAAVSFAPVRISRWLAPLGMLSLWVYVIHLPLLYGWAGTPGLAGLVGPRLALLPALLVGLGVVGASYGLARLLRWLRKLRLPWRPEARPTFRASLGNSQRV